VLPPPVVRDPRTAAIAEHLRAAVRLTREADQLLDALKVCSAQANAAAQRWFSVMHTEQRSPEQAALYAQLEAQVLALSRHLADLRQRHAVCLAQAREHENTAGCMQPSQAPPDRW
jgi:type II secretory pathway component PulJ